MESTFMFDLILKFDAGRHVHIIVYLPRIDLLFNSNNAPGPYPTMHHCETERAHMCTFLLQNGVLYDFCLMHCGVCEMGL